MKPVRTRRRRATNANPRRGHDLPAHGSGRVRRYAPDCGTTTVGIISRSLEDWSPAKLASKIRSFFLSYNRSPRACTGCDGSSKSADLQGLSVPDGHVRTNYTIFDPVRSG